MNFWKLSAGTASVIGIKRVRTEVSSTTAYIMIGEKCRNNCHYCTQARESEGKANLLSRVTWLETPVEKAIVGIAECHRAGNLRRVCLQIINAKDSWDETIRAVGKMKRNASIPVCVSSYINHLEQARELVAAGAERICIALDAATPQVYSAAKEGGWQARRQLLTECAQALPGRVTTHLIVGLGETEEEMVEILSSCVDEGITVGLFAFTPMKGTAWSSRVPPTLGQYRRIQVAHFLLQRNYGRDSICFTEGRISGFDVPSLQTVLGDGKAFETSGCPDCNRPYYNERPGGALYNYPRPLMMGEVCQAIGECELAEGGE